MLNDKNKLNTKKIINVMDWNYKFWLIFKHEDEMVLNSRIFDKILSFDMSRLKVKKFIIDGKYIGSFVVLIDGKRIYPIYILNQNYVRFNHTIVNMDQLISFLDHQRFRHNNYVYKYNNWESNEIDLFVEYVFSLHQIHNDKSKKPKNTQTQQQSKNNDKKRKKAEITIPSESKEIVEEAIQNLRKEKKDKEKEKEVKETSELEKNEKNMDKKENVDKDEENKKNESTDTNSVLNDSDEEINKKMQDLKDDLNDDNSSVQSDDTISLLEELEDTFGIVIEKKDEKESKEEEKDHITITSGAFNYPNPQKQSQHNKQQQKVQSKHKHKNNKNKNKEKWSVVDRKLPIPSIALAKSIENCEDSIFQVSNYTTTYSNRPYAIDHASGTRYDRNESNFDAIDAVTNLASKSKIKEENYVKFIFYSNEFNYQNSKSYFESKIRQMSMDIVNLGIYWIK